MTEKFQNGHRVQTIEEDVAAIRADITEIKLALARQDGERTALKWVGRAIIAILGAVAAFLAIPHR